MADTLLLVSVLEARNMAYIRASANNRNFSNGF